MDDYDDNEARKYLEKQKEELEMRAIGELSQFGELFDEKDDLGREMALWDAKAKYYGLDIFV